MQPPGLEGLLPPAAFSGQPRGAPPAPPAEPAAGMNPGYPPELPPEPPKAPPGSAPLPYGYFGSGYYSCRVARGALKAPGHPAPFAGDKFLEPPAAAEDFQGRPAELAFYPGYAGPYQPVAGYLDVSVVPALGEPRPEALLPLDGGYHQPWALAGGWGGQVCCPKEPGAAGILLKGADPGVPEGCAPRRARRKRVPYSKGQLRELEREFSGSRFITRERRRGIAAATGLSERQVTIWFQNRRVKDKKRAAKGKAGTGGTP